MSNDELIRAVNRLALRDAGTSAAINAVMNWFTYRAIEAVPLTVDSISSGEPTLFSRSIPGALFLCAILGTIAWFKFRKTGRTLPGADPAVLDRPFFFDGLRIVAFYTIFVFGLLTTLGVLLHAWAGTLLLPPLGAAALATLIAASSAFFITASTMRAQLRLG